MPLPPSFAKSGFVPMAQAINKIKLHNGQYLKGLLMGSDGESDTGKTEFALSIPGFVEVVSIDRNFQGVIDNTNPPTTRNPNIGLKVINPPLVLTAKIVDYAKYHADVRESFYGALDNPDSSAVVMDGDSDWWELHVLAHFGKTTQIYPQTRYAAPYAERRAIQARAFDSGKIVLMTSKVKDEYVDVLDSVTGLPKKDPSSPSGENLRAKSGNKETQGCKERDYLYQVWIRHMYQPASTRIMGTKTIAVPQQWGLRITKCKHNMALKGAELWGDDCNFRGLVDLIFPEIDPRRWGFDA